MDINAQEHLRGNFKVFLNLGRILIFWSIITIGHDWTLLLTISGLGMDLARSLSICFFNSSNSIHLHHFWLYQRNICYRSFSWILERKSLLIFGILCGFSCWHQQPSHRLTQTLQFLHCCKENTAASTGITVTTTLINIFHLIFIIHDEVGSQIKSTKHRTHASECNSHRSHDLGWAVFMNRLICALLPSLYAHTDMVADANTPTDRNACMATQQGQDCLQQPRGLIVTFTYHCLGIMLGGWNELLPVPPPAHAVNSKPTKYPLYL